MTLDADAIGILAIGCLANKAFGLGRFVVLNCFAATGTATLWDRVGALDCGQVDEVSIFRTETLIRQVDGPTTTHVQVGCNESKPDYCNKVLQQTREFCGHHARSVPTRGCE